MNENHAPEAAPASSAEWQPLTNAFVPAHRLAALITRLEQMADDEQRGQRPDAIDREDVLRSAATALTADASWRPIATAPKDGSLFLAFPDDTRAPRQTIAYWLSFSAAQPCWWSIGGWAVNPTLWMPLPLPPCALTGNSETKTPA